MFSTKKLRARFSAKATQAEVNLLRESQPRPKLRIHDKVCWTSGPEGDTHDEFGTVIAVAVSNDEYLRCWIGYTKEYAGPLIARPLVASDVVWTYTVLRVEPVACGRITEIKLTGDSLRKLQARDGMEA